MLISRTCLLSTLSTIQRSMEGVETVVYWDGLSCFGTTNSSQWLIQVELFLSLLHGLQAHSGICAASCRSPCRTQAGRWFTESKVMDRQTITESYIFTEDGFTSTSAWAVSLLPQTPQQGQEVRSSSEEGGRGGADGRRGVELSQRCLTPCSSVRMESWLSQVHLSVCLSVCPSAEAPSPQCLTEHSPKHKLRNKFSTWCNGVNRPHY